MVADQGPERDTGLYKIGNFSEVPAFLFVFCPSFA